MATVIDFLGRVLLDDGSGQEEALPVSEYVQRAMASRAKCAWMSVAYHAVVSYVIAGMQRSTIRIRGSDRVERGYEEWLWNVRPNPNQNYSEFITRLIDQMFFGWHKGMALVVPLRDSIWIADGWTEVKEPGRPTRYENISIDGSTEVTRKSFSADELYVFRLAETSKWRMLFAKMEQAYDEMAESSIMAFGDKNDRRYLLKVDQQRAGTAAQENNVNDYLKNSVAPFIKGSDVALPLFRGFELSRMEADYSGGETTLDVVQIRQECFKVVATCLGIPYSFLEGNVNNFESVFDSVLTFLIDPIAKVIQDEIAAKSFTPVQWRHGAYARVDTTHIRHIDLLTVGDQVEKLVSSSFTTPNEVRSYAGLEAADAPGMDDFYMTLNIAKLGEGGENNDDPAGTNAADGGDKGA